MIRLLLTEWHQHLIHLPSWFLHLYARLWHGGKS